MVLRIFAGGSRVAAVRTSLYASCLDGRREAQTAAHGRSSNARHGSAHDGEVPAVNGGQGRDAEPLGGRDHRGVGGAKPQIGVALDQLRDAGEIRGDERFQTDVG